MVCGDRLMVRLVRKPPDAFLPGTVGSSRGRWTRRPLPERREQKRVKDELETAEVMGRTWLHT